MCEINNKQARYINSKEYDSEKDCEFGNVIDFGGNIIIIIGFKNKLIINPNYSGDGVSIPIQVTDRITNSLVIYKDLIENKQIKTLDVSRYDEWIFSKYGVLIRCCIFRIWFERENYFEIVIGEHIFSFDHLPSMEEINNLDPYENVKLCNWVRTFVKENNIRHSEFFGTCGLNEMTLQYLPVLEQIMSDGKGFPTKTYVKIKEAYNNYEILKKPFVFKTYSNIESVKNCINENLDRYLREGKIKKYGCGFTASLTSENKIQCNLFLREESDFTKDDLAHFFIDNGCVCPDILNIRYSTPL